MAVVSLTEVVLKIFAIQVSNLIEYFKVFEHLT